jgi:hypothetical protein
LTLVRGFVGSYPNYFFAMNVGDVPNFVGAMEALRTQDDATALTDRYGMHRTDPAFWTKTDWFNQRYGQEQPVQAGVFDLNRYDNR